jgi:hypothetical protein
MFSVNEANRRLHLKTYIITAPCVSVLLMCQVRIDGLTGHIQFNEKGRRTNFTVSVMELAPSGPKKVSHEICRTLLDLMGSNGIL